MWSLCHVQLKSFCFVASLPVVSYNSSRFFQETTPLSGKTSTFFEKWALINILSNQLGHSLQKRSSFANLSPAFRGAFLSQSFAKKTSYFREAFDGHPLLDPSKSFTRGFWSILKYQVVFLPFGRLITTWQVFSPFSSVWFSKVLLKPLPPEKWKQLPSLEKQTCDALASKLCFFLLLLLPGQAPNSLICAKAAICQVLVWCNQQEFNPTRIKTAMILRQPVGHGLRRISESWGTRNTCPALERNQTLQMLVTCLFDSYYVLSLVNVWGALHRICLSWKRTTRCWPWHVSRKRIK